MVMARYVPSLAWLVAFEAAAKHLNFTRAGEELGMTQSGVSRHIRALEAFLGISLFQRIGPRLVITEAGRTYAAELDRVLNDLEKASIDVVRGWKAELALRVAANASVASRWLAPRMDRFRARHPDLSFEVVPTPSQIDFGEAAVDIAMLRGRGYWHACQSVPLMEEVVAVAAAPSLVPLGERLSVADFTRFPQLQNSSRSDSWLKWLHAHGERHSGPLQGPRFANMSMLINAAVSGLGLAIVPVLLMERELEAGTLHLPFGPPVPSGESYFAVYPEGKAHKGEILAFRDWLLAETRALRQA